MTDKKIMAIMTAVSAYIQNEEEALVMPPHKKVSSRRLDQCNLWGICGRQHLMQMRSLMHTKIFNH